MKKLTEEATVENVLQSIKENKYNRIKDIKDFIEALEEIEGNMFISLDAQWGAGKTFYVRQIEQTLKYLTRRVKGLDIKEVDAYFSANSILNQIELNFTYFPIYYNAWLYDNHDDPLMSLILLIMKEYEGFCNTRINSSLGDQVATLADCFSLLIGGVQIGGNHRSVKEALQGKDILESVKTAEEIREYVKEIFNNVIVENVDKLVIFIDELDRCRPSFAIEMLERIKHYFDDDRIIIIASVNRGQLIHSISKCYGQNFDSTGYLDKFFDRNVYLPELDVTFGGVKILKFADTQYHLEKVANDLNAYYRLSLRENLRFYASISYAASTEYICDGEANGLILSAFVPIIAVLTIRDENKKAKFIGGDSSILDELFNNIPALYQIACLFGEKNGEESEKNFQIGFKKICEVYNYMFGSSKEEWILPTKKISRDIKSICFKLCNGFPIGNKMFFGGGWSY